MVRKFNATPLVLALIVYSILLALMFGIRGAVLGVVLALCLAVASAQLYKRRDRLVLTDKNYEMTRKPELIFLVSLFIVFNTLGTLHYLSQGNPLGTLLFLSMVVTGIALPLINGRCVLILTGGLRESTKTKAPFLALAYMAVGVGGALYEISQGNILGTFLFLLMVAAGACLFSPLIERRILASIEMR